MSIRDRTVEFHATVDSLLNGSHTGPSASIRQHQDPLLGRPYSPRTSPLTRTNAPSRHSEFTLRASQINQGIQGLLNRLEKLTKLTRNKTLADGQPLEVQTLVQTIKAELARLNTQISDLQAFQKMRHAAAYSVGTNRNVEEHAAQIVFSLQNRLAEASSSFTNVLEMRSQTIKAQQDRRQMFSATNVCAGNNPNIALFDYKAGSQPPYAGSRQRKGKESPGPQSEPSPYADHLAIEMPQGTNSLHQLSLMTAAPDKAHLESRSAALQGIEATINELGTIYQQLANMISEQGEQVQRIDMNIEEMHLNIERGHGELTKYLRRLSSNRWLMIKIFAIMIIFVIFFSIFLI